MRPSQPAPRIVRQRKLAKNTLQPVLREDQIDSAEYSSLQNQYNVETGVEKSEEKEYHLQAALKASTGAGAKESEEIPAPPAQQGTDIDYDTLYALVFHKPATYIRFSQTVEECTGCQYNMTTEDDTFLTTYNQKKPTGSKCTEDDFEKLMEVLEQAGSTETPFASVDGTILTFENMKGAITQQLEGRILGLAKDIYEYWKSRKQESGNQPLQPSLKIEQNPEKDDGDPYVCFRRRDVRQTRKTRARDTQSVEKLKRLRKECEEARQLVAMVQQREATKQNILKHDRTIFEERGTLKEAKVRLGIKTDDEDLINQRPQKRKMADPYQLQRPPGSQIRLPGRSDGRPLDADLIQLSDVMAQKENLLQAEIQGKAQQHRAWNQGHVDLTREPLSPVHGQGFESGFRPATAQYQYLMTPPSSVSSESFDQPSPVLEKPESLTFRYNSPSEDDGPQGQLAYRRRIGRMGRLWIDRRSLGGQGQRRETSDQWKYDQDDDEEQEVYELDPYDTKALRFRATIPLPAHLQTQRARQDERAVQQAQQARAGTSPTNNRAVVPVQQGHLPSQAST